MFSTDKKCCDAGDSQLELDYELNKETCLRETKSALRFGIPTLKQRTYPKTIWAIERNMNKTTDEKEEKTNIVD